MLDPVCLWLKIEYMWVENEKLVYLIYRVWLFDWWFSPIREVTFNKISFCVHFFCDFIITYGWITHEKCVFFWDGFVTTSHVVRSMIDEAATWKTNQIYFQCGIMGIANVNCHVKSCNLPYKFESWRWCNLCHRNCSNKE